MGLPTKAAPIAAAAPPPLDIHGFVEFDWVSSFINPQGLLLNQHGAENVVAGLNWTVWHGGGWISNVTVGGLAFADFSHPNHVWDNWVPTQYGDLFDFGGQLSASATFFQYWTLRESYTVVINSHVGGISRTPHCHNVTCRPMQTSLDVVRRPHYRSTNCGLLSATRSPAGRSPLIPTSSGGGVSTISTRQQRAGLRNGRLFSLRSEPRRLLDRYRPDHQHGEVVGRPTDLKGADIHHGWSSRLLGRFECRRRRYLPGNIMRRSGQGSLYSSR